MCIAVCSESGKRPGAIGEDTEQSKKSTAGYQYELKEFLLNAIDDDEICFRHLDTSD